MTHNASAKLVNAAGTSNPVTHENGSHADASSGDSTPLSRNEIQASRTAANLAAHILTDYRPTDARLQAFFSEIPEAEQTRECGCLNSLAQYALGTIRTYLLKEAGHQEDLGKIGVDGCSEAVTAADRAVSNLLLRSVQSRFPKSWSEEHRPKNPDDLKHCEPFVMVDPIDGTEEFKRQLNGGYGNLFAFIEFRDGVHIPVGGMIVTPRPSDLEFDYREPGGTIQKLKGTELWRTRSAKGGIVYEVNGHEIAPPAIRSLEEIVRSGELRFHVRGVFAAKYNDEVKAGKLPGARLMENVEWTLGKADELGSKESNFRGLQKFDVSHYGELVEYAHRLAASLGVKPVFVAAGGSGSGMNELLSGRIDVLVTLPGDRAKEWDIAPAAPLFQARASGEVKGWVSQCNGESFLARGFNRDDATLREGYVASITLSPEQIFDPRAGLTTLNTRSKRAHLSVVPSQKYDGPSLGDLQVLLKAHGQEHLFRHLQGLGAGPNQEAFARELASVDWNRLSNVYKLPTMGPDVRAGDVRTVEQCRSTPDLLALGDGAYRAGQVGVLIVAGGSGTRLGASVPKGCVEAMALSKNSIYQHQAEKVLGLQARYGAEVPLYIMTSDATDRETKAFFEAHDYFGLKKDQVIFFKQGVAPTVDKDGKVMLKDQGKLLQNPDGHGGCYTAMVKHGILDHMKQRGIEYFMYGQVDNLLVTFDDPERVGLMVKEKADVVIKTLELREPKEKQGRLVTVNGKTQVIEYIDVTDDMLKLTEPDGRLSFGWGCPSIYCWSREFFERLASTGQTLPLHPSTKPVTYFDPVSQEMVTGKGEKLEGFIHDALMYANKVVGLCIENRDSEFAAVKQPAGADSIGDSIKLCSAEYRRWLWEAGIHYDDHVVVEISPAIATNAQQFADWVARADNADTLSAGVRSNLLISRSGAVTLNAEQRLQ